MPEPRLFLVDLYAGEMLSSFADADELVAWLKEASSRGNLGSESRYAVFFGRHLSTNSYWKSAFWKRDKPV